jgi:hypothetical protein
MMRKPKPIHPADQADLDRIAKATSFVVVFVKAPFERYRETAGTIEEARTIEARLNVAHGKYGRRAVIYALEANTLAAIFVPDSWPGEAA